MLALLVAMLEARPVAASSPCRPAWTVTPSAPMASGKLAAVAAASPQAVWVVGDGLAAQWDGAQWHAYDLPGEALHGVAVGPAGVWAVGTAGDEGVVDRWDGNAWQRALTTWPHDVGTPARRYLYAVDAQRADDVWVVGIDYRRSYSGGEPYAYSVVLHWDGRSWIELPRLHLADAEFVAVSSASASDVWLAGDDGSDRGLAAHWDGRRWRIFHLDGPPENDGVYLSSIVRHANGAVTLFGSAGGGADQLTASSAGLVFRWNGRAWRRTVLEPYGDYITYDAAAAIPRRGVWIVGNDTDIFQQQAGSELFTVEHPHGRLSLPGGHVLSSLAWDGTTLWGVGWIGTGFADPENDYTYKDFAPLVMRYGCLR